MEKELPVVSYEQFMEFGPCWADDEQGRRRLQYYRRKLGGKANALDILRLRRVSVEDRLWAVLREEFIPAAILHEFACRCAEKALELVPNPDPRSVEAIEAKRKWLRGEITDDELAAARDAARDAVSAAARDAARDAVSAAARDAARDAVWDAVWDAAWDAARDAARDAAWDAAWDAVWDAAWDAARDAARDAAWDAARDAARRNQVNMLIDLLKEEGYA